MVLLRGRASWQAAAKSRIAPKSADLPVEPKVRLVRCVMAFNRFANYDDVHWNVEPPSAG
jgi:hypothetical protein